MSEREAIHRTEKDLTIERSDKEYLDILNFVNKQYAPKIDICISQDLIDAGFVYREPCKVDQNSPEYLQQKHALANQLLKTTHTIDIRTKDEKSASKTLKKAAKKNHSKIQSKTVAKIQEKL